MVSAQPLPGELLYGNSHQTRLLGINRKKGEVKTGYFTDIHRYIKEGDLLVFNNSEVVKASIPAYFPEIRRYGKIHVGTTTGRDGQRVVEPRPRYLNRLISRNMTALLSGTAETVTFARREPVFGRFIEASSESGRDILDITSERGSYIRYDHIPFDLPGRYYETYSSSVPGSVEFPSAGRPFSHPVIQKLKDRGAGSAYLTLHCNLGSLEPDEFLPSGRLLTEDYTISPETVDRIEQAKNRGGRVIAVGTSVVRALESAASGGRIVSGDAKTDIFIGRNFDFRVVDALFTGLHEYGGSHISMIGAFAGKKLLEHAYRIADRDRMHWHEFGDIAFIG